MPLRWKQTFKPILLKDGRAIRSLEEARSLMLALPQLHQKNSHWQYASELLTSAADRNEKYATMDARAQLSRALAAEGLL